MGSDGESSNSVGKGCGKCWVVGGKAGKDGGAVAGGEDAGLGGVHKTANFGSTGVKFLAEKFEVWEKDA